MFDFDGLLLYVVIGLAIGACLFVPLLMLVIIKHQAMIELDHYGKAPGRSAAKSFVCPDCLTRSYAPSHIEQRWCARCKKAFPDRPKLWHQDAQVAE